MAFASAGIAVLTLIPSGSSVPLVLAISAVLGFFGFGWYGPWVVHLTEIAPSRAVGLTIAMTGKHIGIVVSPRSSGFWTSAAATWFRG